jgi:hypothetical protein
MRQCVGYVAMKEELLDRLKSLTIAAEDNLRDTGYYEFYYSSLFPLYDLVENIDRLNALHHLDGVYEIINEFERAIYESHYYDLKPLVMRLWNLVSNDMEFTYPYTRPHEVESTAGSLTYSNSLIEDGYYVDDQTGSLLGLLAWEDANGSF